MESKREQKRQRKRERDRLANEKELPPPLTAPTTDKDDTQSASSVPAKKKVKLDDNSPWNFEVEYNDHFETPKIAYTDLLPVLLQAARDAKKSIGEVR